jgi:hypothetical protein
LAPQLLLTEKPVAKYCFPVLTVSQTASFEIECAFPARSKAVIFAVIAKVAGAGYLVRSILWLDGEQRERK